MIEDCLACDGSGKVTIEQYMKRGGSTKCPVCSGTGQISVVDNEGSAS
jgi:DnaJ-class molecular chaperone